MNIVFARRCCVVSRDSFAYSIFFLRLKDMQGEKISTRARYPTNWYLWLLCICCLTRNFEETTAFEIVEVYEGLPPGSAIFNSKRKPDTGYSLYEDSSTADGLSLFYIDSDGILTTKVTLDYEDERGNVFDLLLISREISRSEGGFGQIVRVRILDRNDNPPKFPNDLYTSTVLENSPIGTYVQGLESVFASDLDSEENSVRKYSIVAGNEAGKFEVDFHELSGFKFLRIKTKAPIDREETPFFVLTVMVVDGGKPSLSSTTQVRVNILDENDCKPKFEPALYSISVNENADTGTSVLQVKATDGDSGTNAEIYYYFKPGHDYFIIDPHTGIVETASELNFKKGNSFELSLFAVDRGVNPLEAKTLVRIRLVDMAGFPPPLLGTISSKLPPPVFQKHSYRVRIREDFPVGGAIVRVEAHQRSQIQTYERTWRYVIIEPDIAGVTFHINPLSGVVSLLQPLDFEKETTFVLKIQAQNDLSEEVYNSHARVVIVIFDVNENHFAPVFSHSTLVASIPENTPQNTFVLTVSASDSDEGSNGEVIFSLTEGTGLGKFSIDRSTGKIRSLVRFSSEMDSFFTLHVRAYDGSKQPLHSNLFIVIRLENSDQKRPLFFSPRQVIYLRENTARGTFVALTRAVVRNRRGFAVDKPLEYVITGGNGGEKFSLNSSSGIISTVAPLDREIEEMYIIDVSARITGKRPSASSLSQVVVMVTDENDNSPSFEQQLYKIVVTENLGHISNLLCLVAYDPDAEQNGNITYSILSSSGPFSVDPVLGILSADESLDFEAVSLHKIVIQAADNGAPRRYATTTVEVNVQDANDSPVFSRDHYEVNALESLDIEVTVAVLRTSDQDREKNGKFSCTMEDMDLQTMDTFTVRTTPAGCALVLAGYLDWSDMSEYSLKIRATDHAERGIRKSAVASVTIHVQDTNNHVPEFLQSSYWVALASDATAGSPVLTVRARDLDELNTADLKYKITSDVFAIDATRGTITLKQGLGSVTNKKYDFLVRATDQGIQKRQSSVNVSVSVHSTPYIPPRFAQSVYTKEVPENIRRGVALLTVRAKRSVGLSSAIEYSIVGGDPTGAFRIDAHTGILKLWKALDYEKAKQHVMVVRAVQKALSPEQPSLPTEVTVIVNVTDVNDNRPRFALPVDPLVTSVNELQPPGTVVTVVKAYDKDSVNYDCIKYQLKNPDFIIDQHSGIITTQRELKRSQGASRSFVVTATDCTPPNFVAKANVVVMINRASDVLTFEATEVAKFIPENMHVGVSPLQLRPLQTPRATLRYFVSSGNKDDRWCIDTTGKLRTNRPIDYERESSYQLKVSFEHNSRSYVGPNVIFSVEDINDNAPTFDLNSYKFFVAENLPENHQIGKVKAEDPDGGSNSVVRYSIVSAEDALTKKRFDIDSTGVLWATHPLDREHMEQHVFIIRAIDGGKPSLSGVTQVTVIVTDENDNHPVFASDVIRASVPVDAKVGSRILALIASDADWGDNGRLRYSITEGNSQHFITVEPTDGSVFLTRRLTSLEPIEFSVMARDRGQPSRNATVDVIIVVHAVDGPPQFLLSSYEASVGENEDRGTAVVKVEAASRDPVVIYSLTSGSEKEDFHLDQTSGLITTTRPLDHETLAQYELVVMAADTSNRLNHVKVVIYVTNVNDNEPRFINTQGGVTEGQVLAAAISGSHVLWLKARDQDIDDVITYSIVDRDAKSYFEVDRDGRLSTIEPVSSLHSPFEFRVQATDDGIPPRSAVTSVRLVFVKYHIQQKQLRSSVPENVKAGSPVTQVQDAAKIPNARFSIISPFNAPFRIESLSGEVSVAQPLDYETTQNYSLIIQVQNFKDPKNYTNIDMIIDVQDVNDNTPQFTKTNEEGIYVARVNRNPNQGTVVYTVTASDQDSRSHLRYSLVSYDDNAIFEVEAESGKVKTRERQVLVSDAYNVTVRVSDSDVPPRYAEVTLHVQVGEYPPTFDQDEYVFTVKENTLKGYTIGDIKARSYSGAFLTYTIVLGNAQNKFTLDTNTGRLVLPEPLDYERDSNVYYVRIRAEEVGVPPQRSEVNVRVLLKDLNDNAPEFMQQRYLYTLPESVPVGTAVLSVTAQDSDSGINGQFRYYMEDSHFSVNPYTGQISTTKPLDYDQPDSRAHAFVVVAQDSGNPSLNGSARVLVTLNNVNDNAPLFSQSMYYVFVAENADPDEFVATVQASDKDLDPVSYAILAGDNSSNFVIDSRTGVVRLVKDRQPSLVGPYYVLNISASDERHVSEAVLMVAVHDINNHRPVFEDCANYRPIISENLPAGSSVIKVSAADADIGDNGRISYNIERPLNALPQFEIDETTGLVTTAMSFDREARRTYQIRITGKDGGPGHEEAERLMGFCQVEIEIADVNDNKPIFDDKRYSLNVPKNIETGHSVLHVSATDKDTGSNALITYDLEGSNSHFRISNTTGIITTKKSLTVGTYKFSVIARDNGIPPQLSKASVVITVFGVGNDPPKFTQNEYNARIREDAYMQEVTRVKATSRNPEDNIYYSIVNVPQPFSINTITGIIQIRHPLDYEVTPNYTLIIRAQNEADPPLVSLARLRIFVEDVNDSPPEFPVSKYEGQVAENSPIGSSVIEVKAKDPDEGENGRVSYKFLRKKSYQSFDLNPKTGLISTKKIFDREETGRYTLIVGARDHGNPSKDSQAIVEIIISDQNDNAPVFTSSVYNVSVSEDIPTGKPILRVSAIDKDIGKNAIVNFYIEAGNRGAAFAIDKVGQISIASSLDRETQDFYELRISAVDGKNSGRAVVYVTVEDVNDNNPVFSNNTYVAWVRENAPEGTYVTTLSATDRDLGQGGVVSFSISGQGLDAFEVDRETGVLITIRSLDREVKARYDFLAFATDDPEAPTGSRRTGWCDVIIRVRDVNDNSPKFPDDTYEGIVRENQLPGATVMTISAVDDDDPNENGNAIMTYKLLDDADGLFKIDRDSGLITTRATLDREQTDQFKLVVKATDRGATALSGQVEVKVKVSDANDQRPQFITKTFSATVSENAAIGSSITVLNATDDDIGINARLRYSIVKGGTNGEGEGRRMFRVGEDTGVLQVARSLDYETKKDYHLTVKVTDSGLPSFSDTAEVTVLVTDYNDNPPVFDPVSYATKIKEDVETNVFLLQVTASDSDTGSNKIFAFSIVEGDSEGRFRIDPWSGRLYVHRRLDREKQDVHRLTVRATNTASDPLYRQASVKITLIDVNDNGPTFRPSEFHFSVRENSPPEQLIGKIDVYDKDLDPPHGAPFSFEITSGNEEDFFLLEKATGKIHTKVSFDREETATYKLGIRAFDNGNQFSDTFVYVHITDDNDNQHAAGSLSLLLNSFQGKFPGGRVGKVYVADDDTDDERYFDVTSNTSEYFTIQRTTGVIISRPNPPIGLHELSANVSDVNSSFAPVVCTVSIHVKEISADAVDNSMAIRLGGVSRERFVTKFLQRFKESVAEILGTEEHNVDLFSVQNAPKDPTAIDVRFAAHGSPYYPAERMTAMLKNGRPRLAEAAKTFDVNILVIGVDECVHEPCRTGGCTNELIVNGDVEVISVKGTAFASIVAILTAKCGDCQHEQQDKTSCKPNVCLNGGTCRLTPSGRDCRCPVNFSGPSCELTTRSFEPGEWVWIPPLQQCNVDSLSLEFATRETDGLLLYGGPTSPVEMGDVHDFLSMELAGGKVLVSFSLGDRNDVVRVGVTSGMALNDGEWHHVEVYLNGTIAIVTVDRCKTAPLIEGSRFEAIEDRSQCSSSTRLKGNKNMFLNLNGPIQLGGVSTVNLPYPKLTVTDFTGCIRNFITNDKYYDLKNPSNRNGSKEGCPIVEQNCVGHQCHAHAKCVPSWTGYSCSCPFGSFGPMCGQRTRPHSYGTDSVTRYIFHQSVFTYDPRETKIQMQIRTRDSDGGVLMFNAGSEDGLFSVLEVVPFDSDEYGRSKLIVTYTIGFQGLSSRVVRLPNVHVGDGRWHNVSVERQRTQVVLSVDSDDEGYSITGHTHCSSHLCPRYTLLSPETLGSEHVLFVLDHTQTFVGGFYSSVSTRRRRDVSKDFVGCINDVRFNGHLLHFSGSSSIGHAESRGVSEGCSSGPVCEPNPCPLSQWCRDIWRQFECFPLLCNSLPCHNGGTCHEGVDNSGNNKFYCQCPVGFQGSLCELGGAVVIGREPVGGFANGIIVGLSVLVTTVIIAVCILIVYLRRSRTKKFEVVVDEEQFKPDSVVNYSIEGGGEEDLEDEYHLSDILKSFETADSNPCQGPGDQRKSDDIRDSYVALFPSKNGVGKTRVKPMGSQDKKDLLESKCSCSYDGSEVERPDSSSSTPERRVCVASKVEVGERHSPDGGEGGGEGSPRRKLTQVFGLNKEEQEGRRSPPEGFSSPDKFESPGKRQRGNGASVEGTENVVTHNENPGGRDKAAKGVSEKGSRRKTDEFPFAPARPFAMENPLSRPRSEIADSKIKSESLLHPRKKPPRRRPPSKLPPPPMTFLPDDALQKFYYEGSGSPTISLSTLGDSDRDSEDDDNYEYVNDLGNKFKKLARVYGLTPSVSFSENDEVI